MTANLMEAVSGLISPDLVQKAARAASESPEGTRAALLGAIPTLFAGLAHATSTPPGTSSVMTLVTRAATKPKECGGQTLLVGVFGTHAEGVTEALANRAGVRTGSAAGILALIGPLVLGALGKEGAARGLGGAGLADLLFSCKKAIIESPDTPKGLAGALGLGSLAELGGPAEAAGRPAVSEAETASGTSEPSAEKSVEKAAAGTKDRPRDEIQASRRPPKWPIMLLPALLLGVLALWGLSNMFKGRPQMPDLNVDSPTMRQGPSVQERRGPPADPAATEGAGAPVPQILPPQMAAPEVTHPESTMPDAKIAFDVASATPMAGSQQSVDELADFLRSDPEAVIHVEGFADSTGNAGANEGLSARRAQAVKDALVTEGIDARRIETSGSGEGNPVAPNGSAHDRAENRRVEVTRVR